MKVPKISVTNAFVSGFPYPLLVVYVYGGKEWSEPSPSLKAWLTDISGLDPWILAGKKFSAKAGETLVMTPPRGPQRILLVGLGEEDKVTIETIRRAGGHAGAYAKEQKISSVTMLSPVGNFLFSDSLALEVYVEGAALALYAYEHKNPEPFEEIHIDVVCDDTLSCEEGAEAIERAAALIRAKYQARDWGNTPANLLTPTRFASNAHVLALELGLKGGTYGREWMGGNHMGALLAVAKGSCEEPRFCHFVYVPKDYDPTNGQLRKIVLIAKGIAFDAGGISLKPGLNMDQMKYDMCGAGAVLASMITVAQMQPNCEVHFLAAMAENLPGPTAVKPGDVVTAMDGQTIEVLNTDAEGRLVLADALCYVKEKIKPDGPDDIVLTFATLTGAVIVALGHDKTALYSNNDELAETILSSEEVTGEGLWRMPLVPEMEDDFKSNFADMANIGKQGEGGSIVGALFLKKFVPENWNWAYCDIAGTAWGARASIPYNITGATGVMVGTITETIRSFE